MRTKNATKVVLFSFLLLLLLLLFLFLTKDDRQKSKENSNFLVLVFFFSFFSFFSFFTCFVDRKKSPNLHFLERDASLLAHGLEDGDQEGLASGELLLDLLAELTLGELDVVLGVAAVEENAEEVVLNVEELQLAAGDVGDIHVVGGRAQILVLLLGEDIKGDEVDLGVSVLAGLGGGHIHNLAGPALDHDESSLAQSRALHGEGIGSDALGGLELLLVVRHIEGAGRGRGKLRKT